VKLDAEPRSFDIDPGTGASHLPGMTILKNGVIQLIFQSLNKKQVTMSQIIFIFLSYACILMLIAYCAKQFTKGNSEFFLAGRKLSGPLTALGAGASDMSSWLLMVLPGVVYATGLNNLWMPLALTIGAYANWKLVAKRLRIYTQGANDSLTVASYLHNRFVNPSTTDKALKLAIGFAMLIFFTIYSAAGFIAGAKLLKLTFNLDYTISLLIIATVIISYTAIGGFFAVSWIDFFQGSLMLLALLIVPLVALNNIGGINQAYNQILEIAPAHIDMFSNITTLGIISLIGWGFGYFGQPHINTRFMAIRSVKELPVATRICMTWMIVSLLGAVATGMVGVIFYSAQKLEQPETVFIALATQLFNPYMTGILLSAILSAIMSNASAQILMSSSILAEDFYFGIIRKKSTTDASKKEQLFVSRCTLIILSIATLLIALIPNQTLFNSINFAWSGLGAAFGPVIVLSLYWRKMSQKAALWGITTGAAVVLIWELLTRLHVGGIFNNPDILPGFVILPGILASVMVILIVGNLHPQKDPSILKVFDDVQKQVQGEIVIDKPLELDPVG